MISRRRGIAILLYAFCCWIYEYTVFCFYTVQCQLTLLNDCLFFPYFAISTFNFYHLNTFIQIIIANFLNLACYLNFLDCMRSFGCRLDCESCLMLFVLVDAGASAAAGVRCWRACNSTCAKWTFLASHRLRALTATVTLAAAAEFSLALARSRIRLCNSSPVSGPLALLLVHHPVACAMHANSCSSHYD